MGSRVVPKTTRVGPNPAAPALCPCNRIGICGWLKPSILEVRSLSRVLILILFKPSILKRYNVHGFRVRR